MKRITGRNQAIWIGNHLSLFRYNADCDVPDYRISIGRHDSMVVILTKDEIAELREALADPDAWPESYIIEDVPS